MGNCSCVNELTLDIKYHVEGLNKIEKVSLSDWVDLRAAETVHLKAGEFKLINLGVSMRLPSGYEAYIVPRSSTFKNFGIIQTNHMGVIDNSYSGDNDIWHMAVYAMRDTTIEFNARICQFRLNKVQPAIIFNEVLQLNGKDRGGFGSSGVI